MYDDDNFLCEDFYNEDHYVFFEDTDDLEEWEESQIALDDEGKVFLRNDEPTTEGDFC